MSPWELVAKSAGGSQRMSQAIGATQSRMSSRMMLLCILEVYIHSSLECVATMGLQKK